jgi:hypothetical protein
MEGIGSNIGLIRVLSNEDLEALADQEAAQQNPQEESEPVSRLAAHCRQEWVRARDAKQSLEREMLHSMRQREGKYSDGKLAAIRKVGGSEIKMMLTDVKCRAAEAMILDVLFGSGERPFSCEPTPLPDIPDQIQQEIAQEAFMELQMVAGMMVNPADLRERIEAYQDMVLKTATEISKRAANRMEDAIDDEYRQGGFYDAMKEVISDLVTLKAGILRGPELNMRPVLQWQNDPYRPNSLRPVVNREAQRRWYCVSPFDLYTSPEARNVQEGTLIQRRRLSPGALYDFIGVEGFDEEKIRKAIAEYGDSGYKDWLWQDSERTQLEGRPYEHIYGQGNDIDVLEVWTKVSGKWLKEWGMEGITDEERWYEANCWLVGNYVIRATMNDDPLGQRPYHMDSFVRVRNSPWGRGIPEIMSDLQDMCDASARAISNNMGIASGPQVEVEIDRLPDGEKLTHMHPWKIWQVNSNKAGTSPSPAIRFFQPNSNADVLMAVFKFFSELADEYTGLPKYQYGDGNLGGAGRTASGLSMLMNASSRLFKQVISHTDHIIISCTETTHRSILLYDEEIPGKGDVRVIAKASQALLHREAQQLRLNETLATTNNPIDFQLMGPKGRLELLRANLRGLDSVDVDKVLPTNDQMLIQEFMMNQQLMNGPQQPQEEQGPEQERPEENVQGVA